MSATTTLHPDSVSRIAKPRQQTVFLGANTPWVYALAEALAASGQRVTAISTFDLLNFRRRRPGWPASEQPVGLQRELWLYPPGYVGGLAPLFAPLLRSRLSRVTAALEKATGNDQTPWIVVPYPWFVRSVRNVPSHRLIYYNLDDYVLYQPARSATILQQESELVHRAALTLCLSKYQVENLRARFPKRADRVRHFPLGVPENLLNPNPGLPPQVPVVGYVGNLIDRVDWRLVREVAAKLPNVQFHFVGRMEETRGAVITGWLQERAAAIALPNVRHVGPVPQDDVGRCYWNFALNWIPYDTNHPFNQASCPTKIMDGLASGRPLVSTDVPECRLYPDWISIVNGQEEAASQIRHLLDAVRYAGPRELSRCQVEFVRERHTWPKRAEVLESWLDPNN